MRQLTLSIFVFFILGSNVFGQVELSKKEVKKAKKNFLLNDRPWTIEIPLWIPGFAGEFSYGDIDIEGEDGVDPGDPGDPGDDNIPGFLDKIFTKEWYLKFFFINRMAFEKGRFIAQFDAIGGGVGSSVKFNYNNKTIVQANFRTINIRIFAGYKLFEASTKNNKFRYELFIYGGTRAHFQKIYSDLDGLVNRLNINPQWVEPILGIQNQFTFKRWMFIIQGDYGGYFVNDKWSDQIQFACYYRFGKFTSIRIGYTLLDLNHRGTILSEQYRLTVRLGGPSVGVGFHF